MVAISIVSHYDYIQQGADMVDSGIRLHSYAKMAYRPVLRAVIADFD
jgi:hypothetical protein